jgi:prepilin-type N-terminal cleavage/methylation domain-containing protein
MTNAFSRGRYGITKQNQRGFSLLETLVAFAILVLVLSVTLQIYARGSRSTRLAHDYAQAVIIAQTKLADFKTGNTELSGTENDRYNWQLQRKEAHYDDLGSNNSYSRSFNIYHLSVTVSWHSTGKSRNVHINTVQLENKN